MYREDHNPPHFHAYYNEYEATYRIEDFQQLQGKMDKRQERLIIAWAIINQEELISNWNSLLFGDGTFSKIKPLS